MCLTVRHIHGWVRIIHPPVFLIIPNIVERAIISEYNLVPLKESIYLFHIIPGAVVRKIIAA